MPLTGELLAVTSHVSHLCNASVVRSSEGPEAAVERVGRCLVMRRSWVRIPEAAPCEMPGHPYGLSRDKNISNLHPLGMPPFGLPGQAPFGLRLGGVCLIVGSLVIRLLVDEVHEA